MNNIFNNKNFSQKKLIAHRGLYYKNIKENTKTAFLEVLKNKKYIGAEFDIHETKDHKFVVIHDSLINRTSDGSGLVGKMTYKELLKFNFGTKEKKEKIPLLEDVLKILKNKVKIIEIKKVESFIKLNNILNKYQDIYVASFYKKYLLNLSKLNHNYKIGLFNNLFNSQDTYMPYDFIGIFYKLATKNIINFFNKNNLEIMLFGIKNINQIKNYKNNYNFYFIIDENYLK